MLSCREWIENEKRVSGKTTGELFRACWQVIYGSPCKSNQVVLDTQHYENPPHIIPIYVRSSYERLKPKMVMPHNVERTLRFQDIWNHQKYRLVADSEPVITLRKGRDGVWR